MGRMHMHPRYNLSHVPIECRETSPPARHRRPEGDPQVPEEHGTADQKAAIFTIGRVEVCYIPASVSMFMCKKCKCHVRVQQLPLPWLMPSLLQAWDVSIGS
eukprot:362822-Chlamydomonas_euryale.AAC.19